MRRRERFAPIMRLALGLIVSGCGDGGGGSAGSPTGVIPPPGPKPTPSPPPPVTPVFGALGQTTSQSFAVYSYGFRAAEGGFDYVIDPKSFDPNVGAGLRLAAPSSLLFSLAGMGEATMAPNGASGTSPIFGTTSLGYNALGGTATISSIYNLGVTNTLKSTAMVSWIRFPSMDPRYPYQGVNLVYGVPTPQSGVLQVGTATYTFQALGVTRLSIDFGTRTVTGDVVRGEPGATVTYKLLNGVLSIDGTIRAILRANGIPRDGVLEGRLTGSAGQELMGRFTMPEVNGDTNYAVGAGTRE